MNWDDVATKPASAASWDAVAEPVGGSGSSVLDVIKSVGTGMFDAIPSGGKENRKKATARANQAAYDLQDIPSAEQPTQVGAAPAPKFNVNTGRFEASGSAQDLAGDVIDAARNLPESTLASFEGLLASKPSDIIGATANAAQRAKVQITPSEVSQVVRKYGLGLDSQDIESTGQSAPFSVLSMGANLAGRAAGGVVGSVAGPVGMVAGQYAGGAAASGAAAYRMDRAQVWNQLYGAANEEFKRQTGREMSAQEFDAFATRPEVEAEVRKHALAEAGFEAAGNALFSGTVGKAVGKAFTGNVIDRAAIKSLVPEFIKAGAIDLAGELSTETATQMAQNQAETALGLRKEEAPKWSSMEDWKDSLGEIFWPTVLTTAGMGGAAAAISTPAAAYNNARMSSKVAEFVGKGGQALADDKQLQSLYGRVKEMAEARPDDARLADAAKQVQDEIIKRTYSPEGFDPSKGTPIAPPGSPAAGAPADTGAVNAADVLGAAPADEQPPPPGGTAQDNLQNRDRTREASIIQMQKIAQKPDYELASIARDQNGAPMVEDNKSIPEAQVGRAERVTLPDGTKIDTHYAVVEADALSPSHFADGRENPGYGAPGKLTALNNGRTAGLMEAYRRGTAANYRAALEADSAGHGIPVAAITGMKAPVLVRVYDPATVDQANLGARTNQATALGLSPSEQASTDAARITHMDDLNPTEAGEFAASRDFVKRFVGALPITEQAGMMDKDGQLSQAGYARIRNAILAKAYGNSPALLRMTESMDDSLRNISKALMQVAPAVAKSRDGIAQGALHPVEITDVLLPAVESLNRLRESGVSVAEHVAQQGMFGNARPEVADMLRFLDENVRRPRKVADFLNAYLAALDAAGNPGQGTLLGGNTAPTQADLMAAAGRSTNDDQFSATAEAPRFSRSEGRGSSPGADTESQSQPGDTQGNRRGAGEGAQSAVTEEHAVFSRIDRNASPEEKVAQLVALSKENAPLIDAFINRVDEKFGTKSKSSFKEPANILSKSLRPSILAKKPWFSVEHVRDGFRFKTVLNSYTDLPGIIDMVRNDLGAEIVKTDTAKVLNPLEWGWRIASFDLRMPNGQLVEYYLPIREQEAYKKAEGHKLFEDWRNRDLSNLTNDEEISYFRDLSKSRAGYGAAWEASIKRTGQDAEAIRAFLTQAEASASGTGRNSSLSSSAENNLRGTHLPSMKEPTTRPSGSSGASTITRSGASTDLETTGFISSTSDHSIAKPEESGYTNSTETSSGGDNGQNRDTSSRGPQGTEPGAAEGNAGRGQAQGVSARPGGRDQQSDLDARNGVGDQARSVSETGPAVPGESRNPEHGGPDGDGNRTEGNAPLSPRELAKQQWDEARADLGAILRDHFTDRMVPEDTPNLVPTLVKLFEAGIVKVGHNLKDLLAYVKKALKAMPEFKAVWNKIDDATYRKAAMQAIANTEAAGGDLFSQPAKVPQGDLFAAEPNQEKPAAAPVAESHAPAPSEPGDAGVANGQGNGGPARLLKAPKKPQNTPISPDIPQKTGRNYVFGDEDLTYTGGWQTKARQNVEAVELLKKLDAEKRQATREEQSVLAKFIGWGASEIANTLFGDKLTKQAETLAAHDRAIENMTELGRDYLQRGGTYQQRHADNGYYAAVQVLQAAGKVGNYTMPDRITKAELVAAKPEASVRKWLELRDRLKNALTDDEWKAASKSTQYAHYTSKPVVKALLAAVSKMGFKGGTILEPGAGIGVFPGLMDSAMASNSVYTGIEYDPITGGILKQLFPDERILVESFIDSKLPENFYDVAFGNPPFSGDVTVLADPKYVQHAFKLHDYFFAKSLDSVKPGGLVVFVTSRYTMDKKGDKARAFMAERADLVGAIRLPQTAFQKNAGTEVVTDVLFLRRKVPGETFDKGQAWAGLGEVKTDKGPALINEYFVAHPEMVLGTHALAGSMYSKDEYTVLPVTGDIEAQFATAVENLPADVFVPGRGSAAEAAKVRDMDFNPKAQKEGSFYVNDKGILMQREGGVGMRADEKYQKDAALLEDYIAVRDALKQTQFDQLNDGDWETSLRALRNVYAGFVQKNGRLLQNTTYMQKVKVDELDDDGVPTGNKVEDEEQRRRFPLIAKLRADPEYTLALALENLNDDTGEVTESKWLTERTLGKPAEAEIKTPADALLATLADLGKIDMAAVAERIGLSEQETIDALGTLVYDDPAQGWVTSDEYLSGNVKKKLAQAEEAARSDKRMQRNVDALKDAQPAPRSPEQITPQIGMNWIPGETYQDFLLEVTGVKARIEYIKRTRGWVVDVQSGHGTPRATVDWGVGDKAHAGWLMEKALTGSPIRLETDAPDGKGGTKKVFDPIRTADAQQKRDQLKEEFRKWLFQDAERTTALVQLYNDKFNTNVQRKFDGTHLTLPGTSKLFNIFDHVKRGAWRVIQTGNTYLAHAVGSGKAQPLDAKVLTPAGWKLMGDIAPGDFVISADGSPTMVEAVFPQGEKEIFRVEFNDGSATECCEEHLWLTQTYKERSAHQRAIRLGKHWPHGLPKVRSLAEIRETLVADHLGAKNHSIPMVDPVQFSARPLEIDAYVMGALLGDGGMTGSSIILSCAEDEILSQVSVRLPDECELVHRSNYDYALVWRGERKWAVGGGWIASHPVQNALRAMGLMGKPSHEKFIPDQYLFNTTEARVALLQGLMDTDGTVDGGGSSTRFSTTSRRLADGMTSLVRSLGGLVREREKSPTYTHNGEHRFGRKSFDLCLSLPPEINPFRLTRKARKVIPKSKYSPARYITAVASVGRKMAQCIRVAHPSHLYVTDDFIVTHNTFEMVISAMEQKRLGLIKKPMVIVPGHMLQQFAAEWQALYPTARLMIADETDFHTENRRRFVSRVAMSDLDGVIMTHSSFGLLDLDPAFKQRMIEKELEVMRATYVEAGGDLDDIGDKKVRKDPKIKRIEAMIEKLEQQLLAASSSAGKDKNVRFDEMGVDMLYVDEAHLFRKLSFATARQVKGIDPQGSKMAWDLYMKTRWLAEKNPGRNLVLASGTAITNTLAELYTVQRLLNPQALEENGLAGFDDWAANFGEEATTIESTASGKYEPVTRFQEFVNVGELTQMFRDYADVLNEDHLAALLGDKRPKVAGGGRKMVITPKTANFTRFLKEDLAPRIEASKNWKPSFEQQFNPDPIIAINIDARLASIDMRFMEPTLPNDPDSKLNKLIDGVIRVYKESAANEYKDKLGNVEAIKGATQMVFFESGFGKMVAERRGFNARAWLEKRLRDAGIPTSQVAFMEDYKKSSAKLRLFSDVNKGKIRVLVGSSAAMGTGVNAQQRLIALHHLDAPYVPAILEQREGRIIRQGNKNPEVQVYAYSTFGSFDENLWAMLARKKFFIEQAMSGDPNIRKIEDVGEVNQLQMAAGLVAENPYVLQAAGAKAEVVKLTRLYQAHEDARGRMLGDYENAGRTIAYQEQRLPDADKEAARVQDLAGDKFKAISGGKEYTALKDWGTSIISRFKELADKLTTSNTKIGEISGFDVIAGGHMHDGKYIPGLGLKTAPGTMLAESPLVDPVGLAIRARNALVEVARKPVEMRRILAEAQAKQNALAGRLEAPFPLAEQLANKIKEANDLEALMMSYTPVKTGLEREQELEDDWQAKTGAITPLFSRGVATPNSAPVSSDQKAAEKLNSGLADHFKDDSWKGAYVTADLRGSLVGYAAAAGAAFGTKIVGIQPTAERFNVFNGINFGGANYINVAADVRFINTTGHELYEELARARPDLHAWFAEHARNYIRNFQEYQDKLNALMLPGESKPDRAIVEKELLADFTGDAMADPKFLAQLAEADGSKFTQLLNAVVKWLKSVGEKLAGKDFGSSRYFSDVNELRKFLNRALVAYANGKGIDKMEAMTPPGFSRATTASAPAVRNSRTTNERADAIINSKVAVFAPIDKTLQVVSNITGATKLASWTGGKIGQLLDRLTPETVKAGMVADYGIPEAVIDRRAQLAGAQREQVRKTGELIDKLMTLTRAESRVAYLWMNSADPQSAEYFRDQLPPESIKTLAEVEKMIDSLSAEAVRLGQMSAETRERNRFAYLHRSYAKHMEELTKGEKSARQRAIAVLGNQYKGRGMTDERGMASIKNIAPEWWKRKTQNGKADTALKGEKFIRLERRQAIGQGVASIPGIAAGGPKAKLLEVHYWPAGEVLPAKYGAWDQAGTWEARDTKGDKLVLWRDFTAQEREAMGEIDEVRYAIAKTLHGMIHDVEVGKYLEWVAVKHAAKDKSNVTGQIVDASESMRDVFKPDTWVQVPETRAFSGGPLKYGLLAGRYLPGPIWNDVRQTAGMQFKPLGETYSKILTAWKKNKTALSPAVHMNNVMSNFVMADWHDVSSGHVFKALRILLAASTGDGKGALGRIGNVAGRAIGANDVEAAKAILARFEDSGGSIGTWATKELRADQLAPLVESLEKELGLAGNITGDAGVYAALQQALHLKFPAAWEALTRSKPGKLSVQEARNMIALYESEDQVFRLGAWLKAKEAGATDTEAGKFGRESFLDYHINAPWVQGMRQTMFPFISFTYRALPMLAHTAKTKPWKLAKLALIAGALNAIGYALSGGDEDKERALLPEEKAGRVWGLVPKLMRMPWNDSHNSPVFIDVRRWIPVGDVFDVGQAHSVVPVLPFMMPGGPLEMLFEATLNKSGFTGQPIVAGTDTLGEASLKTMDWLYKAFMPNIALLPNTYAWQGISDSVSGKTDAFGRQMSLAQSAANTIGVKLGAYPSDVLQLNATRATQAKMQEIDHNITLLSRQFAQHGITKEKFDSKVAAEIAKKQGVVRDLQKRAGAM